MEDSLLSQTYWEDPVPDLRLNPGVAHPGPGLEEAIAAEPRLRGHMLFATSGSGGRPKIVCLSKQAFLTAADWTNRHLECGRKDRWLLALPLFHVGGAGLVARARLAGGGLEIYEGRWDAARFASLAEGSETTVTSLVPAQLHDLVVREIPAPSGMRVVVIGGGRLEPGLRARALRLGWPVRESYGMTETAAQLATQISTGDPAGWLKVIPGWSVRIEDGQIWVMGAPLLSAYLQFAADEGEWKWRDPLKEGGWFATGDCGEIDPQGRLRVKGRVGRVVKILGELVDLERLDLRLVELCPGGESVLEVVEDPRAGWRIVLVTERDRAEGEELAARFNEGVAGFEQVREVRTVDRLRRSPLGKRLPQSEGMDPAQAVPDSKA
jgi:O-succinylbenzoic acid--CoA ligase